MNISKGELMVLKYLVDERVKELKDSTHKKAKEVVEQLEALSARIDQLIEQPTKKELH